MTLSVPFAVGLGGETVAMPLEEVSVLISGLPGSGKSTDLRVIAAGLAHRDDAVIIGIDAKRVELVAWRPRLTALAVELDDITDVLRQAVDLVDARYRTLEANESTRWTRTPTAPDVVIIIDELAEIVDTGEPSDKVRERLLRRLLSKGRAAHVTCVAATQRPSADIIATSLRDLFQIRLAHAQATAQSTSMTLGPQAEHAPAHELPIGDRGVGLGYLLGDGERIPKLARTLWLSPEQARAIAASTAHLKPALELGEVRDESLPPRAEWAPPTPDADAILLGLLAAGPQSYQALAEAAGITADAARKRLARLEATGSVTHANGSPIWSAA